VIAETKALLLRVIEKNMYGKKRQFQIIDQLEFILIPQSIETAWQNKGVCDLHKVIDTSLKTDSCDGARD